MHFEEGFVAPTMGVLLGDSLQLSVFQELPWLWRATSSMVTSFKEQPISLKLEYKGLAISAYC